MIIDQKSKYKIIGLGLEMLNKLKWS